MSSLLKADDICIYCESVTSVLRGTRQQLSSNAKWRRFSRHSQRFESHTYEDIIDWGEKQEKEEQL